MLKDLAKTTTHEDVRNKVLELIQAWTFAFRKSTKYRAMKVSNTFLIEIDHMTCCLPV